MGPDEKYGKRRQITFRIGPLAQERLKQTAALFNMKSCEYVKAALYKDLAIFDEPLDQRRRAWKQKKRQLQEEEFGEEGS
jgi:hypothetical protein